MSASVKKKRQLDPVGTRRAILEAATKLFSESGFAATSMGGIAECAGVTKSLIQYHFHTKEELWEEVVMTQAKPLLDACNHALASDEPYWLAELMLTRFRMLQERPEMARLIAWAALSPALVPKSARQRVALLLAAKKGAAPGQEAGPSFPPDVLVAALFGAVDGFFLMRSAYEHMTNVQMSSRDYEEQVLLCLARAFFGYDERLRQALNQEPL